MTEPIATPPIRSSATPRAERALGPDVARGLMLLGIALANVAFHLFGRERGVLLRPTDPSPIDRVADVLVAMLADNRSMPLFALLFGYGVTQLVLRQQRLGTPWPQARGILVKRNLWLLAFGAVHGILLFSGDILGTYALLGLVLILLVRSSDKVVKACMWVGIALYVPFAALDGLFGLLSFAGPELAGSLEPGSAGADSLIAAIGSRAALEWIPGLFGAISYLPALLGPALLGTLLARHRVLDEPWRYRPQLRLAAIAGIGASLLGALPIALALSGATALNPFEELGAATLHGVTGLAGAVGVLALIGLVLARGGADAVRRGPVANALAALGRRSLSGYLAQSLLFVLVFAPYAGGLGATAGTAVADLVAVGVWALTLLGAVLLERAGRAGPAETLLRRLTYGARPKG